MKYKLYQVYPFPSPQTNQSFLFIEPTSPFFLTDESNTIYGYISSSEECEKITLNHRLCKIESSYKATAPTCEYNLLAGLTDGCVFFVTVFKASIWHRINSNQWLFVVTDRELLTVQHKEHTNTLILPRTGIITLPPGTTASTSRRIFHAGRINSTEIEG